MNTFR